MSYASMKEKVKGDTEFDNYGEWDNEIGIGNLIIDLDADIEKSGGGMPVHPPNNSSDEADQPSKGLKMKIKWNKGKNSEGNDHEIVSSESGNGSGSGCSGVDDDAGSASKVGSGRKKVNGTGKSGGKKEPKGISFTGTLKNGPPAHPTPSTFPPPLTISTSTTANAGLSRNNETSTRITTDQCYSKAPGNSRLSPSPAVVDGTSCINRIQVHKVSKDACVGTCTVGTLTEPENFGPCEPGTSVCLEGIIWQETDSGVLVVNVTWRGKTYVGTLLDSTKHDWAPPRFCDSPIEDFDPRLFKSGRGKRSTRGSTPQKEVTSVPETRLSAQNKLRGKGRRGVPTSTGPSPLKSGDLKRKRGSDVEASPGKRLNRSNSRTLLSPSLEGQGVALNENGETAITSSVPASCDVGGDPDLLECPEEDCRKKFRSRDALKYHLSHSHPGHSSLGDDDENNSASDEKKGGVFEEGGLENKKSEDGSLSCKEELPQSPAYSDISDANDSGAVSDTDTKPPPPVPSTSAKPLDPAALLTLPSSSASSQATSGPPIGTSSAAYKLYSYYRSPSPLSTDLSKERSPAKKMETESKFFFYPGAGAFYPPPLSHSPTSTTIKKETSGPFPSTSAPPLTFSSLSSVSSLPSHLKRDLPQKKDGPSNPQEASTNVILGAPADSISSHPCSSGESKPSRPPVPISSVSDLSKACPSHFNSAQITSGSPYRNYDYRNVMMHFQTNPSDSGGRLDPVVRAPVHSAVSLSNKPQSAPTSAASSPSPTDKGLSIPSTSRPTSAGSGGGGDRSSPLIPTSGSHQPRLNAPGHASVSPLELLPHGVPSFPLPPVQPTSSAYYPGLTPSSVMNPFPSSGPPKFMPAFSNRNGYFKMRLLALRILNRSLRRYMLEPRVVSFHFPRANFPPLAVQDEDKIVSVPPFAESVSEGDVRWEKGVGDKVNQDDLVCEIETDKTAIPVPSPVSGVIAELFVEDGSTVQAGTKLFRVTIGEGSSAPSTPKDQSKEGKAKPAPPPPKVEEQKRSLQEKPEGEELRERPSSTPSKPVEPLKSVPKDSVKPQPITRDTPMPGGPFLKLPPTDPTKEIAGTRTEARIKMNRMRQRIAARLKEAQNVNAMLTTFNEVDMTNLIQLRKQHQDAFVKKHGIKLGFMSAFCKAAAYSLLDQPVLNAVIDGTEIVYRDYVDISVAVATPKGLVVPVLRNVESMNYAEIEKGISALGEKAKKNALAIEDMEGGTFTISNGGVFGSLFATPIINPPQSAILGMYAIKERPMVVSGRIEPRPMMYLALTYDHRLIDGREATLFLVKVKQAVEDPRAMLLGL
ncbi:unnamed protein product [Cyprideis torosa]|uniref:Dihydrolipoyllysine-residue succinyltransferase component of 2-oxoglutarate dehydrogenase complex, mitochondrial n=1 Tax=Cyprideis torosa TaxID=163714 RepID=A0A7R8WG62_9CRUS|nr:unnamed protein product [Cyprideis torosa]CAG0897804.1 unnamed protein product [Cyprideis torosa]